MSCYRCLNPVFLIRTNLSEERTIPTNHTDGLKRTHVLGRIERHPSGLCRSCLKRKAPDEIEVIETKTSNYRKRMFERMAEVRSLR